MLNMVGTGMSDKGISLDALEACSSCSKIYIDRYTSTISERKLKELERLIGKNATELSRSEMEEKAGRLIEEAARQDIAILTGGDPLIATTHKILFIAAKKRGVTVAVYHSGSIVSAAMGESGLDFYRFGSVITIARWSEHYKPTSFYRTIENNQKANLHTLLLLDYDGRAESSIGIKEAVAALMAAEKENRAGIIRPGSKIIVMSNISQKGSRKRLTSISSALKMPDEKGQAVIIMPAKLTDIEMETIDSIYGD